MCRNLCIPFVHFCLYNSNFQMKFTCLPGTRRWVPGYEEIDRDRQVSGNGLAICERGLGRQLRIRFFC